MRQLTALLGSISPRAREGRKTPRLAAALRRVSPLHLLGHCLARRNPLHDDAQFMRRRRLQRLAVAENGVAAVDGEMQFVAAIAEAFDDLLARPGGNQIDVGDRVRVTHADDADIALADLARAFELDP